MRTFHILRLVLVLVLALGGLSLAAGSASAESNPLVIDTYDSADGTTGVGFGTRTISTNQGGSTSFGGGSVRVTVPQANNDPNVTFTYTAPSGAPIDLTAGGATQLRLAYNSITSTRANPPSSSLISVTGTDVNGATRFANSGTGTNNDPSVLSFMYGQDSTDFRGSGDLTKMRTLQVAFRAVDNSGGTITVDLAGFSTVNPTSSPAPEPVTVNPASLPAGTVGVAYSQVFTATGGSGPYRFAVTSGTLPPGMSLDTSTGRYAGTPTAGGSSTFTVSATNAGGTTGARTYTATIAAATITVSPATIPNASRNAAYSQTLTAAGGTAPYSFAVTAGALPAGLSLSSGGALTGTPTTTGSFSFTATARDSSTGTGPYSGSRSYALVVNAAQVTVNPATIANPTVGVVYQQSLSAAGGTGPYTYARSAGALPPGLTISTDGVISGTATAGGAFTFTITATDRNGDAGARSYQITVAAPAITIAPATLPDATRGIAYDQTLTAAGGTAPYTFSVTAGALPRGLTLSSAGRLSGTPEVVGSFTFTAAARDSSTGGGPFAGQRTYTLAVTSAAIVIDPGSLPGATVNTGYSQTLTASGGAAPYQFDITAGALPSGLALSSAGVISGTPTAAGTYTSTVTATDSFGSVGSRAYTVTVAAPTIQVSPATLPDATGGVAYDQVLTASGSTAPYTFAVTAGALPAGLTLSAAGRLSGTPTRAGRFTFTVTARDSSTGNGPYAGSRAYTLTVAAPSIAVGPQTLPRGTVGAAYSQDLTATGGSAPYTYVVSAGRLPAGLTLSADGVLRGTPTEGGDVTATVTATDRDGFTGSRGYTIEVVAASVQVSPGSFPPAVEDTAYSQALTASGGTAPYGFTVTAGALPAGLTLSSAGVLSGRPTTPGTSTFTVRATDSSTGTGPYSGSRAYTLQVDSLPTPSTGQLPAARGAEAYRYTFTATGGTAPYTWAVTAGSLPAGVSLATDGVLSGTPSGYGPAAFEVTVTDARGLQRSRASTLEVIAPTVTISPDTLPRATQGTPYAAQLVAAGGTAPYTYAVVGGTLPAGLSLSPTGAITGTPTTAGTSAVEIRASDSGTGTGPATTTRSVTVVVAPAAGPPAPTPGADPAPQLTRPSIDGDVVRFTASETVVVRLRLVRRYVQGSCRGVSCRPTRAGVRVAQRTVSVPAGSARLGLPVPRAELRPGRYRLQVRVTDASGQRVTRSVRFRVRR